MTLKGKNIKFLSSVAFNSLQKYPEFRKIKCMKKTSTIYTEYKKFSLNLIYEITDTQTFVKAEINRLDGNMPTVLVDGKYEGSIDNFINDFKCFADRHRVFFDLNDIIHKQD
jgi:hypothetical protein